MEIKGRINQILPEQGGQSKNGSNWRKQDYILETLGEHAKNVCFSIWGDKIDQYRVKTGDNVNVHFDVESREFKGRWYTDIKAWKIEKGLDESNRSPSGDPGQNMTTALQPEDDLPF